MKYKTFLEILLLIALLSTVIIMTVNNVEAIPNYYRVEIRLSNTLGQPTTANIEPLRTHFYINGIRVYENINDLLLWHHPQIPTTFSFNVNHAINTLHVRPISGVAAINVIDNHHYSHVFNVNFEIYRNNTLITSGGSGLNVTHPVGEFYLNLPCPSFPCPCFPFPLPPPIFELPPPPVLTPPVTRPEFFNFTTLDPFFDFVDALFLPFAQVILNILWIFLGILDLINNTLITFWAFYDTHVIYEGFFNILGFAYMFFEIPEIMAIMVFGLVLIIIKIYLKR